MRHRTSEVSKESARGIVFAAAFTILLIAALLLAAGVQAQESATEQTGEVTTSEKATGEAADQNAERTTAAKDQEPAGETGETTAPVAKDEDPPAQAESTSEDSEQAVQGSGQQAPTGTTEDDTSTTARVSDTLAGEIARLQDEDSDGDIDLITINADDCDVVPLDASVTLRKSNQEVRVNGIRNNIRPSDDRVIIVGPNSGEILPAEINDFESNTANVVRSSGISCGQDNGDNDGGGNGDDDSNGNDNDGNDNDAIGNDALDNLDCDELLRRFRTEGNGQYGDGALFSDGDIRNQIIVCLEQEVDQDTAADEQLPNTGGPSLVGLAALVAASALAGTALTRGRRED